MRARVAPGLLALCACGLALGSACAPDSAATAAAVRSHWDPAATKSPPEPPPPPADDPSGGSGPSSPPPGMTDADVVPPPDAAVTGGPTPPPTGDPSPAPNPPDAGGNLPPDGGPIAIGPCMLKFDVTTVTANGNYAPKNVGAIWVSDANGKFVKTLRVWANARRRHLNRWIAASGQNTTDAITSATQSNHGLRSASWDCSDVNHKPVPAGGYQINVEFTERNGAGPTESIAFRRGAEAQSVTAPDQGNFKGARIQVMP
jgi:hypothetical protein